jgi:hypothetical protein
MDGSSMVHVRVLPNQPSQISRLVTRSRSRLAEWIWNLRTRNRTGHQARLRSNQRRKGINLVHRVRAIKHLLRLVIIKYPPSLLGLYNSSVRWKILGSRKWRHHTYLLTSPILGGKLKIIIESKHGIKARLWHWLRLFLCEHFEELQWSTAVW